MPVRPTIAIAAGALGSIALAFAGSVWTADDIVAQLSQRAAAAAADAGAPDVTADFTAINGWPSRHPLLVGGEDLGEQTRADAAQAIAAIPGVGGIRWSDGTMAAESGAVPLKPMHCQDDVEALLRARTVRFEESSSAMDTASRELLDEVEAALRPCLGSIIAITGHTDNSGPEPGNLALSRERANAVRNALISRGIPADGLRAIGRGSSNPVDGLDPADPANRRIEFSVIATEPLAPTPVDTPGAR
ncbi:OmpA family protein [Pontixanthobacter aestiaquae]|uniref:OmpA family protein n=1 Tax=Pontixanthobacter aestiaquae TaxID=1509367 RepID=A0A844Z8D6_9SPHN|nr:OmpA family protein [Pontixanthobacter aestiaquae]MDN3644809.1 OmpA family protein [Pontixanthobacter aestiaquae]MXO84185.1 OmpA family protein [Pontixanthobacter aestiaquae]